MQLCTVVTCCNYTKEDLDTVSLCRPKETHTKA